MEIKEIILDVLKRKKEVRTCDLVNRTGFSRAYLNRFFQQLKDEGKIILIGKANKARYILADKDNLLRENKKILNVRKVLQNKELYEDIVLRDIKQSSGIFLDISNNVKEIVEYAFLEMLNNAIEHSRSKDISVNLKKSKDNIYFEVIDKGVGIFANVMKKKKLKNKTEAIQDILKGKLTTAPDAHSGEGIFFTSKVAGIFTIQSSDKKLIFNNFLNDVFLEDIKQTKGTKVKFLINIDSSRKIEDVFRQYTDNSFKFSKTHVNVKLYKIDSDYISRSQARRIMSGLHKFKTIKLDFNGVKTVGQGFADEIFRVWLLRYPGIEIIAENMGENVRFMVNRALA